MNDLSYPSSGSAAWSNSSVTTENVQARPAMLNVADIEKYDRQFGWKRWTIIALWGLYVLWTAWGTVSNAARLIGGSSPREALPKGTN